MPFSLKVTRAGSVLKPIHCAACGADYIYELRRKAVVRLGVENLRKLDEVEQRGAERADARLQRRLAREVDVVPCPKCGHCQPEMIPAARKAYLAWMVTVGLFFVLIGLLLAAAVPVLAAERVRASPAVQTGILVAAAACGVLGVGLVLLKLMLSAFYDPNAGDQDVRIRLGQSRAILKEDLEQSERTEQIP
jgi:hypothetical protein